VQAAQGQNVSYAGIGELITRLIVDEIIVTEQESDNKTLRGRRKRGRKDLVLQRSAGDDIASQPSGVGAIFHNVGRLDMLGVDNAIVAQISGIIHLVRIAHVANRLKSTAKGDDVARMKAVVAATSREEDVVALQTAERAVAIAALERNSHRHRKIGILDFVDAGSKYTAIDRRQIERGRSGKRQMQASRLKER
jgi:hypothetical protein